MFFNLYIYIYIYFKNIPVFVFYISYNKNCILHAVIETSGCPLTFVVCFFSLGDVDNRFASLFSRLFIHTNKNPYLSIKL